MKKIFTLFFALIAALIVSQAIEAQTLITCAQAREYALSVSGNNVLYNDGASYAVEAYVTRIHTAWSSTYHNITFWMADTDGGGEVIEAYRCSVENEEDAPNVGDRVRVVGQLTKYNSTPEFAAECTCEILGSGTPPVNLGVKTIAEFISLANTKDTCILIGWVTSIASEQYSNLYIEDNTGSIYVYGLKDINGSAFSFSTLGIEEGDTLTISGTYKLYNTTHEVVSPRLLSHVKPIVPPDPIDTTKTEVDFATDFAQGWDAWIGKTLTFTNDFYVNDVSTPTASYIRLRNPEEYGDDNDSGTPTAAYNNAVTHNNWANCTIDGLSFSYYDRPGIIIRGMKAKVTAANYLTVVNSPTIIKNELPTQRPDLGDANVVVCGANIENFFVTLGGYAGAGTEDKLATQKAKISKGLYHIDADIYALCEMEQGPNAAPVMVQLLNNLAGKNQYDWVNAGFEYSDAVMVCFIYRKDKVEPVGSYITPYTNTSSAYHYREAIQCFRHLATGEKFNISLNHFKAKGSSATDSQRQTNMSYLINYGLTSSTVLANDPDILVMGDLNAYTNEESNLKLSRDRGYTDLLMKYDPQGYSYVYDKTVGYLDHAYANSSMAAQVTKAVSYHINADTYYRYEYKYGDDSMYRYADHDPILVGLHLGDTTTAVENVTIMEPARKEIRHGQIVIIRGEQVYTITGQRLY